jgi:hypothetical protein
MRIDNSQIGNNIFFTKEILINGLGLELDSNQTLEHEFYDTVDITGGFKLKNTNNDSLITYFSLFENTKNPCAQALIDINKDENNKLNPNIIIKNKCLDIKFEYLEKCYNFFINTNSNHIIEDIRMVVDLYFNPEDLNVNNVNVDFLITSKFEKTIYDFNLEVKCEKLFEIYNCKNIFEQSSLEELDKIIKILQYDNKQLF